MSATAGRDPILAFAGVAKTYGARPVLEDVTLDVAAGDFMVIYGPPASGKSVLMRLLMGLEHPTAGQIVLRGADVTRLPAAERDVGYIPQSFALYPHLSVRDNIAYPLKLAGVGRGEAEPIVQHAAEMLKIGDLLAKQPDQLSGGQKQRVAIARGIAKQTDLFVLDDPLAGLDFKLREQLVDDLKQLQVASNATFVYTTSDAIEALTLADHLAVLAGGRIAEVGPPDRLYDAPTRLETMGLLGFPRANFLPGTVERHNGRVRCVTDAFAFAVEVTSEAGRSVSVGVRPEHVAVGEPAPGDGHKLCVPARVLLREDLGGEEIVYLDAAGTPLTSVVRHDQLTDTIPDQTTIALDPRDLVLFAADGSRLGQGTGADHG